MPDTTDKVLALQRRIAQLHEDIQSTMAAVAEVDASNNDATQIAILQTEVGRLERNLTDAEDQLAAAQAVVVHQPDAGEVGSLDPQGTLPSTPTVVFPDGVAAAIQANRENLTDPTPTHVTEVDLSPVDPSQAGIIVSNDPDLDGTPVGQPDPGPEVPKRNASNADLESYLAAVGAEYEAGSSHADLLAALDSYTDSK